MIIFQFTRIYNTLFPDRPVGTLGQVEPEMWRCFKELCHLFCLGCTREVVIAMGM